MAAENLPAQQALAGCFKGILGCGVQKSFRGLCPAGSEGIREGLFPEEGVVAKKCLDNHVRHNAAFLKLFKGTQGLAASSMHGLHFLG